MAPQHASASAATVSGMNGWWVSDVLNSGPDGVARLVSWVVLVIGSIVLHELAHGWMAIRLGDSTPRDLGHMTWNPLVHMGGMSLVAFALVGIAWGAMPWDPTRARGRYAEAKVSIAGPAMNLLIALISFVALIAWGLLGMGVSEPLRGNLWQFFYLGVWLNIVLAAFNLVPVLPLDGGRIAASFSPAYRDFAYGENGQWVMFGGFILFFWFGIDLVASAARLGLDAAIFAVNGLFP